MILPWSEPICGTHAANSLIARTGRRAPLARRYHCLVKRRRWESNPLQNRFAGGCRAVWLQRQVIQCPRQESNLVYDLRRVACSSVTLRRLARQKVPRRGIEPRLAVSRTAVRSGTPAGHFQSVSRPGIEPGPGPSEGPMRSVTPSRQSEG